MKKKILIFILCVFLSLSIVSVIGYTAPDALAASGETVTYLDGSDLLYDLMETSTTFVVVHHKALGGSHYAYTEGLFEESTGEAATAVGTESNFTAGSKLVLLTLAAEGDKVKKTEKVLLDSPSGCIRDPDVAADGTKVIFSWKQAKNDDFHIYEMSLTDGKYKPRQLTFGSGVADIECMYLPTGEILFASTRAIQTVDCWITPVSNFYKMSADGTRILRLGYDQVHTTYPTLTEDGRVIYTRWDYNDRTQMFIQGLFQMNPDGTNQTELYGNNSSFPTTLVHTRQVNGENSLYVSIATGHHTYQAGKLCFIDVSVGRDGKDAVTFPFPDSGTVKQDDIDAYGQSGALYQYPYALNAEQLLVSYSAGGWGENKRATPFGIYLMDVKTKQKLELVKGTEEYPAAQILPVKTRDVFVRPSMVDYSKTTGTYYIGDVYTGEAMEGVERGSVKQIRVVALEYRAYSIGKTRNTGSTSINKASNYTPIATGNGAWDVKAVLGVATVYADGSAMFSVPSETPVYFQLLDKDGNVIQTMRSWSTLMPNEIYSCVGCHEDNNTVPPASATVTLAAKAGVETLKPDVWQTEAGYDPYTTKEGFSYLEEVQPILDANCISCHDNRDLAYMQIRASSMAESGVATNFSGTEQEIFGLESEWKYKTSTENNAEKGWNNVGFDDSSWKSGKAGFGDRASSGAKVGTKWSGNNKWIFLRKTFTVEDASKYQNVAIRLQTWYDDTPIYYLNGIPIYADGNNWTDGYVTLDIGTNFSKYLRDGENVLAISINQHTGGRFVDASLSFVFFKSENAAHPISFENVNIGSGTMSKYYPLSYLVLTGSLPFNNDQWRGTADNKYLKWNTSMSGADMIPANTYGAVASPLMQMLRAGHQGVKLTDTELRTIAAWIDLCVPCYGEYDTNNHWDVAEMREAEEEQNKRDYYDMQNDYTRMEIAGTLPSGMLQMTYKSGTVTYTGEGKGIVNLYVPQKIKYNDLVTVTLPAGVKYIGFTLSPKMGESIVYCPNGTFTYQVPNLTTMVSTISKSYANTTNYVTARILTEAELSEERNLAENAYDYTSNEKVKSSITGQYPHVTASMEMGNSITSQVPYLARNAIDGFCNNQGSGMYPLQSWQSANASGAWFEIDFGRAVQAKELGIVFRHAAGDTWAPRMTVTVTYADGSSEDRVLSAEEIYTEQILPLGLTRPIVKLKLHQFILGTTGNVFALTEVKVYGTE